MEPLFNLTSGQQVLAAMISAMAVIIVGMLSFIGGRGSVSAQLQAQLNGSFKNFTDVLNADLAGTRADLANERMQRILMEGKLRELQQYVESLEVFLRSKGFDIPAHVIPSMTVLPPQASANVGPVDFPGSTEHGA